MSSLVLWEVMTDGWKRLCWKTGYCIRVVLLLPLPQCCLVVQPVGFGDLEGLECRFEDGMIVAKTSCLIWYGV
jgi:hypothetical protein